MRPAATLKNPIPCCFKAQRGLTATAQPQEPALRHLNPRGAPVHLEEGSPSDWCHPSGDLDSENAALGPVRPTVLIAAETTPLPFRKPQGTSGANSPRIHPNVQDRPASPRPQGAVASVTSLRTPSMDKQWPRAHLAKTKRVGTCCVWLPPSPLSSILFRVKRISLERSECGSTAAAEAVPKGGR